MMRRESSEINNFLQLPDTLLIYLVTILCFDAADEAHIDDTRFSLQCINKKFYSICNCKALWQNKPIILPSGKFNDGTFKLIKRKTQGTEGICYHAYCRPHQKEYAIKRVNRIFSEDEGVPYYMLRVLSALRNLRHPGVNELLYVSLAGPKIYTIYPYVELTLQDVLSPGQKLSSPEGAVHGSEVASSAALSPLEQHVAIDMMSQLMSAISYLHDRGILHRNLKPKHILIAPPPKSSSASSYLEGAVLKISDFSLARTTFHPPRDLTAEVITLWYRPPEILLGHGKYTSAVDVWSAGCVFAEMLEGRPLFAGLSEIDQLFQIFSKLGSPDTASSFRELPFYQDGIFPDWDKNLLRNSMRSLSRAESASENSHSWKGCPQRDDECVDLLNSCFLFEPSTRIIASDACRHPCLLNLAKRVPPTASGQGKGSESFEDPSLPQCMRAIPSSITAQHNFLRSLETARGSSGGTGTRSKVLEGTESEQAWEDMGLGDDFAITDWMIKISYQFSDFTCLRTVFLAGALMERFKRDCSCPTAVGDDLVTFSSNSNSHVGSISQPCQIKNEVDACRSASAIHLKLLGATCLHMASKLEDVAYVGVRDFLLLMANSDPERNTYRVADILQLEESLLTRSNFEMYLPTVIDFLHIYFDCIPGLKELEPIQSLSKFLGEVSLLFPSMFAQRHAPSVIAVSILSYAMSYFGFLEADSALRDVSEYSTADIIACVHSVVAAHRCIERKHIYSAVAEKYSAPQLSRVSHLPSMSFSDRIVFLDRLHDLDQH